MSDLVGIRIKSVELGGAGGTAKAVLLRDYDGHSQGEEVTAVFSRSGGIAETARTRLSGDETVVALMDPESKEVDSLGDPKNWGDELAAVAEAATA